MNFKNLIYGLLICVIAISGYRLMQDDDAALVHIDDSQQAPEFTGKNLLNTTYDETGIRNYRIYSDQMEYFSKSGKSYFDSPKMYIYREGEVIEWKVTAKTGILDKEHNLVLSGDVLIDNQLPDASFDTLETESLTINLDSKDFSSNVKVTLQGPLFKNIGNAMKGNFDQNVATLSNKVQGYYEQTTP
ncbi:MAG: LPS export ABC transporter periplasmic protein LptC [Vibrio sp.]